MSRSSTATSTRVTSPVKFYLTFNGQHGKLQYWDGEKNVDLDEVSLALMDTRSCVVGWNDKLQARIWSNKVKSISKEPVTVHAKNTELVSGIYTEIKDTLTKLGGKFATMVYALATFGDHKDVPVAIELSGSSIRPWIDFVETCGGVYNMYNQTTVMSADPEVHKKGAIKFRIPQFASADISPETAAEADRVDRELLQPYLNGATTQTESGEPTPF